MAEFIYEGVDRLGNKVKGQQSAGSEADLRVLLRGQGVRPTKIGTVSLAQRDLFAFFNQSQSVKTTEIVIFTRQLQVLVGSGIPLVQALEILADQSGTGGLKNVCITLKTKVSEGSFFWEALAQYPKIFPKLYTALIRAGEMSGSLELMLRRLSTYLEDSDRLKKMLKSAMMYPAIVISIAVGVVSLMLIFVIPKFEEMLSGNGQELPGPTKFVIMLSHGLVDHILPIIGVLVVGGFFLFRFVKSEQGKLFMDRAFFNAPIFGPILQKGGTARFSRTMSTLLSSGVNVLDALDICQSTVDNAVLEDAVSKVRPDVEQGKTLGGTFSKLKVFPLMATQMIMVGENTGQLDKMLEKVADFYEAEVEILVGGLTKLIEPIMLVFLGGVVGGIMIAMYLPIFKMADGVK